jgi:DNA-binding response OmpR family regulator
MEILVVEDQADLARHIVNALTRAGHTASAMHDGLEALNAILAKVPHLVILDLNLPTLDGFSILTRLRKEQCPARVIILTAHGEVEDRVKGLNAGADDYLAKPFAMDELIARVNVLGRRGGTLAESDLLKVADVVMDIPRRRVTRNGEKIELSPREFEVLQTLMTEPGRTFTRSDLCERIWQRDHQYDTRTVEIFIMRLRKKLETKDGANLIQTVRGVGYQMSAPE